MSSIFKTKSIWFLFCFFFSVEIQYALAQDSLVPKHKARHSFFHKAGDKITAKRNWLLGIMLNRTPETGFLTGLHYMQFFKMSKDTNIRTSNIDFTFSYTQNRQVIAMLNNTLQFKKGKYMVRGTNAYKVWNEYFWGVGNDVQDKNRELINYNLRQVTQRFNRAINSKVYVGLQYQYYQVSEISSPKGGLLDSLNIAGGHGSLTSGLGAVFLYDSRDNVINPYRGFYLDISNFVNDKALGSNFTFNNFSIDTRKYIRVYRNQILALQGIANFNYGNVPFRQLACVGGEKMMRGYYLGRYRDKKMIAFQAEYRFPVWKFVGLCVFGSCAEVANTFDQFNAKNVLFTYGICLRLMWIKHERVNVGFDVGFGKHTAGSYGGTGEVF